MTAPERRAADRVDPGVPHELESISREIVDRAIEGIAGAPLSRHMRLLAQTGLRVSRLGGSYSDVITDVERFADQVGQIGAVLQRCAQELIAEEEAVARRSEGSDVWWNTRSRAVGRAISLGQGDAGLRCLATAWLYGLERLDWKHCRWILDQHAFPEMVGTLDRLRAVTYALENRAYAGALDPLDGLLEDGGPDARWIDEGAAVRLGLLRTRILSREFSDREMTRRSADSAVARAGSGEWRPLALAGLAEVHLAAGEVDAARSYLEAARTTLQRMGVVGRPATDVFVASGLVLEHDGFWALADECYDRAAEDSAADRPVLLRPVPSRLLVRVAISGRIDAGRSLELLERALEQGISGEDDYPERDVHLARAEKLIELADEEAARGLATKAEQHRVEAARSLVDAGNRYAWVQLGPQAAELFRRACELAPDVAEFRWTFAEQLRLEASRVDGTLDLATLQQARDKLQQGLRLRPPGGDEAWVLVTQALIGSALTDGHEDTSALIERALLKDPEYTAAYGFLVRVLRRQGLVQEAVEAATDGRRFAGSTDAMLFEEHLRLLLDQEDYDTALRLVERQSLRQPDDEQVLLARVDVLLQMGRAQDALAELEFREPTEAVRSFRARCLFATGDAVASEDEFCSLWSETYSGPARDVAGWAAFHIGLVDEAIARFSELRTRAPASTSYISDLGQMLLVRGQVDEGRVLLEEGIAICPYPAELRHLAGLEFDFVRHATAHAPHRDDVVAVLGDLDRRIGQRCSDLLQARRPAGELGAVLASARLDVHGGRPLEALARYEELVGDDEVPEALDAALRSARLAQQAADELFAREDPDGAYDQWTAIERAIVGTSPDSDPELLRSLACRRMLTDLVAGAGDDAAAWLADVAAEPGLGDALVGAARTLAYDPEHLWTLRDGLLALAGRDDVNPEGRRAASRAAGGLPLSSVYHLDAAEADTRASTFLFISPLELRLGPGVEELRSSGELSAAIAEVRARVEMELGVRIPWASTVADPGLAGGEVEMHLSAQWVGSTVLTGERESWVPRVTADLEDRLRGNAFRLVGVDDVAAWLQGWEPGTAGAPAWDPTDPRADRLRLARVLRMLLREHVPVRDRETIVVAVRSLAGVEKRTEFATLHTLLDVRRRLGGEALGAGNEAVVVPLPARLEKRVSEGLLPDQPVWELPRDAAHRLVADLREWLRNEPVPPGVVRVTDGGVRPFVWRLLAAERPVVQVLSEEELS